LDELKQLAPISNRMDFSKSIEEEGVNRRDFMKWASATTAMLMLPASFTPVPVVWIELQDCAGNSEALLRSDGPQIDEIILDIISLEFHETLMAPSGHQAEKQLEEAIELFKGKYLLFVEGSVPMGMDGQFGTIGAKGETFIDHLTRLSNDAAAIVAVGSCATFGGYGCEGGHGCGAWQADHQHPGLSCQPVQYGRCDPTLCPDRAGA